MRGLGPMCWKSVQPPPRDDGPDLREALDLVNWLAAEPVLDTYGLEVFLQTLCRIGTLGLPKLVNTVAERHVDVIVMIDEPDECGNPVLAVSAPYRHDAVAGGQMTWKRIEGRRWNPEKKVNTIPASQRAALWMLLLEHYHGLMGMGPNGPFRVYRVEEAG